MSVDSKEKRLKLFSANLGKEIEKIDDIRGVIREHEPDIIMLQEVICFSEELYRATSKLDNLGYKGLGSSVSRYNTREKKVNNSKLSKNLLRGDENLRNHTTSLLYYKKDLEQKMRLINHKIDPQGRFASIQVNVNEKETITFWSIYGPPEGEKQKNDFYRRLTQIAKGIDETTKKKKMVNLHIFAGDMNERMNEKTDKKYPNEEERMNKSVGFKNFILEMNLEDSFQKNSKREIDYTFSFRPKNKNILQEVRIDWILNTKNEDKLIFHNKTINPTF